MGGYKASTCFSCRFLNGAALCFTLSIKIAQKPYIIGSLGPKALKYESFEGGLCSGPLFSEPPKAACLPHSFVFARCMRYSGRVAQRPAKPSPHEPEP